MVNIFEEDSDDNNDAGNELIGRSRCLKSCVEAEMIVTIN